MGSVGQSGTHTNKYVSMMLAGGEIGRKYLDGITNTDGYTGFGVVVVGEPRLSGCPLMWRLTICTKSKGDGRMFPRNPRSDEMLARLAAELVRLDKDV
jgi:hypothetical protein